MRKKWDQEGENDCKMDDDCWLGIIHNLHFMGNNEVISYLTPCLLFESFDHIDLFISEKLQFFSQMYLLVAAPFPVLLESATA